MESKTITFPKKNQDLSNKEKITIIQHHFSKIMETLGLELESDSLRETPKRVAKMYVNEIFSGLDINNRPQVTLFENEYKYQNMVLERDINVNSYCEHHFLPIIGKAHVAYISSGKVIGISKLNRIVDYYSKRPQVQERLCVQVANELQEVLETRDIAILIKANHNCVTLRGIKDVESDTVTSFFSGKFKEKEWKQEFFDCLKI